MQTKVIKDEYKGNPMFKIIKVDEDGEQVGEYPVVSFGLKKAKAILDHKEELEQFIEENDK